MNMVTIVIITRGKDNIFAINMFLALQKVELLGNILEKAYVNTIW